MSTQFMRVTYSSREGLWEAASSLNGIQQHVRCSSPSAAFEQMCGVLQLPTGGWLITVESPHALRCEYLSPIDDDGGSKQDDDSPAPPLSREDPREEYEGESERAAG